MKASWFRCRIWCTVMRLLCDLLVGWGHLGYPLGVLVLVSVKCGRSHDNQVEGGLSSATNDGGPITGAVPGTGHGFPFPVEGQNGSLGSSA